MATEVKYSTHDDGTPSVYWCPDCLFPLRMVGYMKDWASLGDVPGAQFECPNGHRHFVKLGRDRRGGK